VMFAPRAEAPASAAGAAPTAGGTAVSAAPVYLGTPSLLQVLGTTAHSAIVRSNPVDGAVSYSLHDYETGLTLARATPAAGASPVFNVQGLQSGTDYDFFVVAIGPQGQRSAPSQPVLARTQPEGTVVVEQVPVAAVSQAPATSVAPTYPGLPTVPSPSGGYTGAPPIRPVQTQPSTAATGVFSIVSVQPVNQPVQPNGFAYVDVTVANDGDTPAGTSVYGYQRGLYGGPITGHFAPESTGVVPPGGQVTVRLRSAGRIAAPQQSYVEQIVFYTASGGAAQSTLTVAGPDMAAAPAGPTSV
jgi:hypothetical protein